MKYRVIVETDFRNRPKEHELSAAILIANYFETDITFLRPSCQHTQSTNVILDLRRIKMHQTKALANIRYYFTSHRSQIRHLMVITKSEVILEII